MIHISKEQKIDRKHIFFSCEPLGARKAFHAMHILPVLRLELREYFYHATVYNYSKQAVISISVYLKATYSVRVFYATNAVLCFY